jgi:bifunctional UDP-N-acetylglucosamine pyrophosphorylase/glucosamine-1-phosphate N-acetyltransferase
MFSDLPKVLHPASGRSLISYPVRLARSFQASPIIVVVGHGRERVVASLEAEFGQNAATFAVQHRQLGTADAVRAALPALLEHRGPVLVLSGDVPLLSEQTLRELEAAYTRHSSKIAFVVFEPRDPTGYGRVLRESGQVRAIKEHRDCSDQELGIREVNAGIYLIDADFLRRSLGRLTSDNDQGELLLPDLVSLAAAEGIVPAVLAAESEVGGVNDRADLARVEGVLRARKNLELMRSGVAMSQPETVHVDLDCEIGPDTSLGPGVQLHGQSRVGRGCVLETGVILRDSRVEDAAIIKAYSVLENAKVGPEAIVGPFARLRPGTQLGPKVHIGNFVETKNTVMAKGSKANHLAYLGDGVIGERVNVGAGTIFCNYDGYQKHTTVLEDDVFIGSDSQLVAPVTVGQGAYVGSGSTITKNVPADALAMSRVKQENRLGIAAALRRRFAALKQRAAEGQKGGDQ